MSRAKGEKKKKKVSVCLNRPEFTIINREPGQRSKIERFGKIILLFNYFCKKLNLKFLRASWIRVGF